MNLFNFNVYQIVYTKINYKKKFKKSLRTVKESSKKRYLRRSTSANQRLCIHCEFVDDPLANLPHSPPQPPRRRLSMRLTDSSGVGCK